MGWSVAAGGNEAKTEKSGDGSREAVADDEAPGRNAVRWCNC